MQPLYDHIEGLRAREPVGAILTAGTKGDRGNPIHNDRFYIKLPYEETIAEQRVHAAHPSFKAFNESEDLAARQTIRGNLVHLTRTDAFHHQLTAQVLGGKWPTSPTGRPACEGDGERATRLYAVAEDGTEDRRLIPCPNDKCEFRQGENKACKPFARLYFRPRWKEGSPLPSLLLRYQTHSWNSVAAILGFFDGVEKVAQGLGIESASLFGLPFVMTLGRKTNRAKKRSFPVVSISVDGDLVEFFIAQQQKVAALGGRTMLALPVGAQDPEETTPEALAAAHRAIVPTPPAKPGHGAPPVIDAEAEEIATPSADAPREDPGTGARLLSAEAIRRIRSAQEIAGMTDHELHQAVGGRLEEAPAGTETEILKAIEAAARRRGKTKK